MSAKHHRSNDIVESQLTERLLKIEETLDCDAIVFIGPIVNPLSDDIRETIEGIQNKRSKLSLMLETDGGYVDSARRIAETLRHHYKHVDFVVPGHAMSAGTILVMSGDNILMDYYSMLGPIDPQIPTEKGGRLVPALGYLVQFERLLEKSNHGLLNDAELAFLLNRFDPGELYQYEQERELSVDFLKEWLVNFKFKDWVVTETGKIPVTEEMRIDRAEEIARSLNDPSVWHSHGRGITMSILRNDLRLKVEDFGANKSLNDTIRGYYCLLKDYMGKRNYDVIIHSKHRFIGL